MYARVSTWLGKRLKVRNVRVPLTNNEQIRVAPVSRHPTQKPAALLNRSLPPVAGLDSQLITHGKPGPQPNKVDQQGNHVPVGPSWFEKYWRPTSTNTVS